MVFPGNPLRPSDLAIPIAKLIDWIHDEGIGHHWMAGYGHVGEKFTSGQGSSALTSASRLPIVASV